MSANDSTRCILFVCTGNTCRSPMAEGLMRASVQGGKGIHAGILVKSAGVAAMPGQKVSRETQDILKEKNAGLKRFKSRQVDEAILRDADLIITMTDSHADVVKRFFPDCAARVKLLCDFIDEEEGLAGADLPDPIGMGREAYLEVAEVIELAIPGILNNIKK